MAMKDNEAPIIELVAKLTDREKAALETLLGVDISDSDQLARALSERNTASDLTITRKRIREVEKKALRKLGGDGNDPTAA